MNEGSSPSVIIQTRQTPFESLSDVEDHIAVLSEIIQWTDVGILFDDAPSAILNLLLDDNRVVAVTRFCLSVSDSVAAIQACTGNGQDVHLGCWQGKTVDRAQIGSLEELTFDPLTGQRGNFAGACNSVGTDPEAFCFSELSVQLVP